MDATNIGELVKQLLVISLGWIASAIVWIFETIIALLSALASFIADIILIFIRALMQFLETMFALLRLQ